VHTDLLAAGKIPDPFFGCNELGLQWIGHRDWEYRLVFEADAAFADCEAVELVADGLDTVATVTLNGRRIAATENMFVGHRWNVKTLLRSGPNELRIHFRSARDYLEKTRTEFTPPKEYCDPVGNSVRIRKQACQFGWDWGPRLVSAGIWRDLRLEGWNDNRLADVRIKQTHHRNGSVTLAFTPEFVRKDAKASLSGAISLGGQVVAEIINHKSKIINPSLWWPSGQGAQPLYDVEISARDGSGRLIGEIRKRIGLRTVVLDRHPDRWGESFQIVVNGRPIFMKGANWVPAHSFVSDLTRERYARDLRAAVAANMNCIRLWGGGIYENEHFYDLCDEFGLLVWHDFMFACTLYPSDRRFLASVREEAVQQVKRIRHRACLALWCGNNELVQLNAAFLKKSPALMRGYKKLFHELLPGVVAEQDGVTSYWPTSEWRETFETGHALGEKSGDTHYWDVWHARHPVKDYEKWAFRFCSEFGMQSYSSPETNATFCPPGNANVFGPAMENHQKNRAGNQIILDYVSRRYRLPRSQDDLIYLSQLNQAYCMQTGVEHYRRLMPRCMGSIYWQLNDCWPVASWSSIEFTGRWKALHHAARRFYAPALVSGQVVGDEESTIGNYRKTTVREVHIHTVFDGPQATKAMLSWELHHLDGRVLMRGNRRVVLRPGQSVRHRTLDLSAAMERYGRDFLYLRLALETGGSLVSEQTVFLTPPRFMDLPKQGIKIAAWQVTPTRVEIGFDSEVFHHAVAVELPGLPHAASDNFFDLYPGRRRRVVLDFDRPVSRYEALRKLQWRSLATSYE